MAETLSLSEENYLKAVFALSRSHNNLVSTTALAEQLNTRPASVTEMICKLSQKQLVIHKKYRGVSLNKHGKQTALRIVRKHRLWEVFLHDTLGIEWHQVHDIAEQLEHIQSPLLTERLAHFLGNPRFDPHGDPIPSANGELPERMLTALAELPINQEAVITVVSDQDPAFLLYLDKIGARHRKKIKIKERFLFDGSIEVILDHSENPVLLSQIMAQKIMVKTTANAEQ